MRERMGVASIARPEGKLVWLHAASIGEAMSLLTLIDTLHQCAPHAPMLITTGTVTSARLLEEKLPPYATHQFMPLDAPAWTSRFLNHWKPDLAVFTESELWPNMILNADANGSKLALVNARMSEKSFTHWQMMPEMIRQILAPFACIIAQSKVAADRYANLSGKPIAMLGNLKHDADMLGCDDALLQQFKTRLQHRPCMVAASLHPGEEDVLIAAHQQLKAIFPTLISILVPRHPNRGRAMAETVKAAGLRVALRSQDEEMNSQTDIYIADTIGELGLWYRLADVVVMGGSFIAHGGQNPLEPARIGAAILCGPHMFHFSEIVEDMLQQQAIIRLGNADAQALANRVEPLLANEALREAYKQRASAYLQQKPAVAARVADVLAPLWLGENA